MLQTFKKGRRKATHLSTSHKMCVWQSTGLEVIDSNRDSELLQKRQSCHLIATKQCVEVGKSTNIGDVEIAQSNHISGLGNGVNETICHGHVVDMKTLEIGKMEETALGLNARVSDDINVVNVLIEILTPIMTHKHHIVEEISCTKKRTNKRP